MTATVTVSVAVLKPSRHPIALSLASNLLHTMFNLPDSSSPGERVAVALVNHSDDSGSATPRRYDIRFLKFSNPPRGCRVRVHVQLASVDRQPCMTCPPRQQPTANKRRTRTSRVPSRRTFARVLTS